MELITAKQRLQSLVPKCVVKILLEHGVIAGGAVLWALGGCDKLGDIDLFVNNVENFKKIVKHFKVYDCTFSIISKYSHNLAIVTVTFDQHKTPIQLIYCNFKDINQLLGSFDLDFIKCGLTKNKLLVTEECQKAITSKMIQMFVYPKKNQDRCCLRLSKAINKGYKCPFIGNHLEWKALEYTEISYDELKLDSVKPMTKQIYFDHEENLVGHQVNVNDLRITGFDANTIVKELRYTSYRLGNFLLSDSKVKIEAKFVSIKLTITKVWKFENKYIYTVKEKLPFRKISSKESFELGEVVVIAKGYSFADKMSIKIHHSQPNCLPLPIEIPFSLRVDTTTRQLTYENKPLTFN